MDLSGGQQRASRIRRETPNGKLRDFSFVDSPARLHSTKVPRRRYDRGDFFIISRGNKVLRAGELVVNLPRNRYRTRRRISSLVMRGNC
jgi:hypothetical protein